MKKFLIHFGVFLIIFIIFISAVLLFNFFVVGNQNEYIYNGAIIDKLNRLNSINEPKIIIVGNSNVAFGINSKMIEDEIGMPVVNLGLHGSLGNRFHQNIAKSNINEGDIVVMAHTNYDHLSEVSDYRLMWVTIEKHTEMYKYLDPQDYKQMLYNLFPYVKSSTLRWISGKGKDVPVDSYSRTAFNEYGDIVRRNNPRDKSTFYKNGSVIIPLITDDIAEQINDYNKYIEDRGAKLVVAAYPIADGEYTPSKDKFDNFEDKLREKLDCDVISHFSDYFIPVDYFYDAIYHLNDEGVTIRTNLLINDLKQWMNK